MKGLKRFLRLEEGYIQNCLNLNDILMPVFWR